MSRKQRVGLLGLAVVIAVVAVIIIGSSGSDSTESAGPATIDGQFIVELENAKQTLANVKVEP